jgi:hypothetical protein
MYIIYMVVTQWKYATRSKYDTYRANSPWSCFRNPRRRPRRRRRPAPVCTRPWYIRRCNIYIYNIHSPHIAYKNRVKTVYGVGNKEKKICKVDGGAVVYYIRNNGKKFSTPVCAHCPIRALSCCILYVLYNMAVTTINSTRRWQRQLYVMARIHDFRLSFFFIVYFRLTGKDFRTLQSSTVVKVSVLILQQ